MKIAIIQFPGSNCERETMLAVQRANMEPVPFLWNEPQKKLVACDGCIIVGGFSYEDRGRAGLIASLDHIMQTLYKINAQGKPILGICNGAQVLVESGLVPGILNNRVGMALAINKRVQHGHVLGIGFYNDWVYVKPVKQRANNAFLRYLTPKQPIHIPAAHAEGRFILPPNLLKKLRAKNAGMLQYCNAAGDVENEFPVNPNGSEYNLAAVCNVQGNAMAIMPHPERTSNGDAIFNSMRDYIKKGNKYIKVPPLSLKLPKVKLPLYKPRKEILELIVDLIITDNTAVSIRRALRNLGIKVNITRQTHWEIQYKDKPHQLRQKVIDSYELFNPNKEKLVIKEDLPRANTCSMLVQDKDNLIGQHKYEILTKSFGIETIAEIKQGILWHVTAEEGEDLQNSADLIMDKHVLFNPYAHDCFIY